MASVAGLPSPVSAVTVSGTVAVSNFPATQPVSGTVNVGNFPATTTVVGTDTPADGRANPTTDVPVTTFGEVFNGTTWDRLRAGTATGSLLVNNPVAANLLATVTQGTSPWVTTVSNFPATQPVSGTVTATGTDTPADGRANPTTDIPVTAFPEVFNGTTWDRLRAGTATGSLLVNNPTAANFLATVNQGTNPWTVSLTSTTITGNVAVVGADTAADAHANPTTALVADAYNSVFNGTTWDRLRSGTALGSIIVNNATAANLNATVFQGTSPWVVSGTTTLGGQTTPTTSLNAQSTVQNGTVQDDGSMRTHHTIVLITSAGVTAGTVVLQLSQDNVNWFNAVTFSTTTASTIYSSDVTGAFRYSRVAITVAITGGTVTATIAAV